MYAHFFLRVIVYRSTFTLWWLSLLMVIARGGGGGGVLSWHAVFGMCCENGSHFHPSDEWMTPFSKPNFWSINGSYFSINYQFSWCFHTQKHHHFLLILHKMCQQFLITYANIFWYIVQNLVNRLVNFNWPNSTFQPKKVFELPTPWGEILSLLYCIRYTGTVYTRGSQQSVCEPVWLAK